MGKKEQLRQMSKGKIVWAYRYPDSLILVILAAKECFGLPVR